MATKLRAVTRPAEDSGDSAFEIKGTVSSLTVLRLRTADVARVEADLATRVVPHPQIFLHAPLVIDVSNVEAQVDWAALVAALRGAKLVPVGVAGARPEETERAVAAGLGIVQVGSRLKSVEPAAVTDSTSPVAVAPEISDSIEVDVSEPAPLPPPPVVAAAAREPMLVSAPVRGGQVIYAKGVDLVVVSSVNPGAQVISDGTIQIWGPLRGRALAGAQGRKGARILCLSLEAELVSVNGEYVMADEIPDSLRGKPAQIILDGDRVKILPL
jgi:septum site-determining protein MinC